MMSRKSPYERGSQAIIGLALSHEQFPMTQLVEFGVQAERAGFGAVWADDHFEPWQDDGGHSGLAWVTLAALGQRTQGMLLGTGVTCPLFRYRPQIVAQAFASLGLLYPGRVYHARAEHGIQMLPVEPDVILSCIVGASFPGNGLRDTNGSWTASAAYMSCRLQSSGGVI